MADLYSANEPAHFYNTIELSGAELSEAIGTAKLQADVVMAIYRSFARPLTPSEVHTYGTQRGSRWLLTSVRRSISDLTEDGLLVKLGLKEGPYGRPEHQWELAK